MTILHILLSHKCELDRDDGFGATALYKAVYLKRVEMARVLLEFGANPNTKTQVYIDGPGDTTPLHYATYSADLAQLLLDHGADPTARDSDGHTPPDWLELHRRRSFDLVESPQGWEVRLRPGATEPSSEDEVHYLFDDALERLILGAQGDASDGTSAAPDPFAVSTPPQIEAARKLREQVSADAKRFDLFTVTEWHLAFDRYCRGFARASASYCGRLGQTSAGQSVEGDYASYLTWQVVDSSRRATLFSFYLMSEPAEGRFECVMNGTPLYIHVVHVAQGPDGRNRSLTEPLEELNSLSIEEFLTKFCEELQDGRL